MFSFFSFSLSLCLQQFLIKCLRQMSSWLFKNVPVPICTYASIDECTLLRTQMLALFHWPFCCFFFIFVYLHHIGSFCFFLILLTIFRLYATYVFISSFLNLFLSFLVLLKQCSIFFLSSKTFSCSFFSKKKFDLLLIFLQVLLVIHCSFFFFICKLPCFLENNGAVICHWFLQFEIQSCPSP